MRKFVAAFSAFLLAAFVTLFGVVAPAQATVDNLTVSKVPSSIAAGTTTTDVVVTTNTGSSLSSISAGSLLIGLDGISLVGAANCTGVTISVGSTSCAVTTSGSVTFLEFLGVNYTSLPSIQIVFTSGRLLMPNTGTAMINVNQKAGNNQPVLASGAISYTFGQQQQQQQNPTSVSMSYASAVHTPAASIASLANGDNFPAYTAAFSGVSGGTYDTVNLVLGDPMHDRFYTVPGATGNSNASMISWDPNSANCGILSITRGGVALTASSGVTCGKMTVVYNGVTQYWLSVKFTNATADDITVGVAAGAFVVANPNSTDQFATFLIRNDTNSNTNYSARKFQLFNAAPASPAADTSIALPTGIGQPVAGQTVGINASNLALNTNYSVVLRSTPQILDQGTTTATIMNTTVTIPAGLEPGWHSITFTAVRSDGQTVEQVAYFKINASGILLETAETTPAELAYTGRPEAFQWTTGALLAVLGATLIAAVLIYRRRVFEMVYVLTGNGGRYDIELVEQPKNARYIPMRKL